MQLKRVVFSGLAAVFAAGFSIIPASANGSGKTPGTYKGSVPQHYMPPEATYQAPTSHKRHHSSKKHQRHHGAKKHARHHAQKAHKAHKTHKPVHSYQYQAATVPVYQAPTVYYVQPYYAAPTVYYAAPAYTYSYGYAYPAYTYSYGYANCDCGYYRRRGCY